MNGCQAAYHCRQFSPVDLYIKAAISEQPQKHNTDAQGQPTLAHQTSGKGRGLRQQHNDHDMIIIHNRRGRIEQLHVRLIRAHMRCAATLARRRLSPDPKTVCPARTAAARWFQARSGRHCQGLHSPDRSRVSPSLGACARRCGSTLSHQLPAFDPSQVGCGKRRASSREEWEQHGSQQLAPTVGRGQQRVSSVGFAAGNIIFQVRDPLISLRSGSAFYYVAPERSGEEQR